MISNKRLSAAPRKKIETLERLLLDSSRKRAKVSPAQARTAKKEARGVLAKVVKLTKTGTPVNSVDRAIFQQLKKKDSQIKKEIKSLLSKGKPTPMDYYRIYHRVLNESGLISIGELDPGILGRIRANNCDYCKACSVCAACTASITLGMGLTVGMVGAAT